jgi:small ligand-binding sensory domain FIST
MERSLFLGLAMTSSKESPEMGDFLVRHIVGLDRRRGTLALGALPRPGQAVRFHVRDAQASAEDMKHLLTRAARGPKPKGALMFSCLGRGADLYGEPDVDSRLFLQRFGPVPLAGFFANGEIGPVGGATYLHGYTNCLGLFAPRSA